MALFGRREKRAQEESTTSTETAAAESDSAAAGAATARGPWDVADRDDTAGRVDLGALRIPGRAGMALRMELDRATKRVIAANVTIGQSNLHLQAFSAPRTAGIWNEIRAQIATSITAQGGEAKELPGPFGTELVALLPVRDAEGKVGRRPARFLGVDGPRWFLRGVLTGAAVVDPTQKAAMEEYFSQVVVVRGQDPRPPSELLPLTMPGQAAAAAQQPAPEDILSRGPEITEVR